MVKATGKSITSISLHNRRPTVYKGYGLEHLPFLILYGIVLYHCYETAGDPYRQRLQELQEKGISHPALTALSASADEGDQASSVFSSAYVREDLKDQVVTNSTEGGAEEVTLPNPFLPGFWPLVALASVVCLHVLMLLLQVWFVSVLTLIKYKPATSLKEASYVKVTPRSHRGKTQLVPLHKPELYFMFQRRKYIYDPDKNVFSKVHMPINYPLDYYLNHTGYGTAKELQEKRELYGRNNFEIPSPEFMELFKQQLVAPLTVFQVFCVLLWMLDEYWQYSLFTLFMIISFEGITVFSRLKNLKTLRGMGNEAVEIHVYRCKKWTKLSTEELLPGDLVSVKRHNEADTIPADCLLLSGSAVVNEATLTGESVPQMKEAIAKADENGGDSSTCLDMKSSHKVHVLFCGTKLMQQEEFSTEADGMGTKEHAIRTPDGGCLALVLRTGFSSSQGKLVRMIEYSSESVNPNTMESLLLIAMLLVFALISSGYVLKKGLENKDRSQFELLLHCVLIITSVVPPELPMQMALAVNSALMALIKLQIFCTEPFRIPLAGRVDVCMFDKTGTITTDQLTAVGVVGNVEEEDGGAIRKPRKMVEAPLEASLVLAGCHSLVQIDGKTLGDPVEEASLKGVDFTYNPGKLTSFALATRRSTPVVDTKKGTRTWPSSVDPSRVSVEILHRHHFKSKLQRMSVIARVQAGGQGKAKPWALVKGSPEAIEGLLVDGEKPTWYTETYLAMARDGLRVLALAYKELDPSLSDAQFTKQPRSWAESDLKFAGFVAFTCLVRKDSRDVVMHLQRGSHRVAMITGDSVLTAIHVAVEVNIIPKTKAEALILTEENGKMTWLRADNDKPVAPYGQDSLPSLAQKYALCVTGSSLSAASERPGDLWDHLSLLSVYARMTPEAKERVLTRLKQQGHHTLMCGDGANDVGALKQAHVGVALLSGFGSANVDKGDKKTDGQAAASTSSKHRKTPGPPSKPVDYRKLHVSALKKKLTELQVDHTNVNDKGELIRLLEEKTGGGKKEQKAVVKKEEPKTLASKNLTPEERRELMAKKQAELEAEVRRLEAEGVSFARVKAIMNMARREAEQQRQQVKSRQGSKGFELSAQKMAEMYDLEDGELPMVKLGDASIASPFTSKIPSIRGTVDIIRQGRCALVTTIQMYQILALNCLISSYSLSVLYLDGVKYGDRQMTSTGVLMTVSFLTLSRATPLQELSRVRPLTSIFHPALFLSLLGQFAIHLFCMIYAVGLTKQHLGEEWKPSLDGKFKPNLINTVVFMISTVQQVSVFAVNYKGRPFMQGITENPGLLYSLGLCGIGIFVSSMEIMPMFNKFLQLVPFPDKELGVTIFTLVAFDILGTLIFDRLMVLIFAKELLIEQIRSTTPKDVWKLAKMFLMMSAVVYLFTPTEEGWAQLKDQGLIED